MTFVLKKFKIYQRKNSTDPLIEIQCRRAGILNFFLSLFKIIDTTFLLCFDDHIEYKSSSIKGGQFTIIPTAAVTGIISGYKRPLALLILSLIASIALIALLIPESSSEICKLFYKFFYTELFGIEVDYNLFETKTLTELLVLITIVMFVFFIIQYLTNKMMYIGIQNGSHGTYSISFKRSIIENISINMEKVNQTTLIIRDTVLRSRRGTP